MTKRAAKDGGHPCLHCAILQLTNGRLRSGEACAAHVLSSLVEVLADYLSGLDERVRDRVIDETLTELIRETASHVAKRKAVAAADTIGETQGSA